MEINKKVLHVVNISFVLPYYIGEQFNYLRKQGIQFFVACHPDDFFFTYAKRMHFTPIPMNILREINIGEDVKAIRSLAREIRKQKMDTVIAHTPKGALVGMIAAYLAGVKQRVYFRHGLMYETSSGWKRCLLKNIERLTGRLATQVVCVSPSVKSRSEAEHLNPPSKNILLNKGTCNGIDAGIQFNRGRLLKDEQLALKAQYHIHPGDKVVGYVGRLVKDKGIPELIAAWKKIIVAEPSAKLLLVGPFEERDAIDEAVKDYILREPSIIHTGLINDVVPYYGLMDVFILPSYREGFPTVVLEASAMELPVITTRATGCIDAIIEYKTGIFTKIDADDIARQVLYYFSQEAIAQEHGRKGRQFVLEQFDQEVVWQEIAQKILNLK